MNCQAIIFGASMGSMVSKLTAGKRHEAVQEQMAAIAAGMSAAMRQCETLMKRDIESFNDYMSVLAMPKDTADQQELRRKAIGEAAHRAAEVPMALMKLCHQLLTVLLDAVQLVNRNVISDWGIAALMLDAAAQSAWMTVEINLASIEDAEQAGQFRERGAGLSHGSAQLRQAIMTAVRERL